MIVVLSFLLFVKENSRQKLQKNLKKSIHFLMKKRGKGWIQGPTATTILTESKCFITLLVTLLKAHYSALHCTALYCSVVYFTLLYFTQLHCTLIGSDALQHCTLLHRCTVAVLTLYVQVGLAGYLLKVGKHTSGGERVVKNRSK